MPIPRAMKPRDEEVVGHVLSRWSHRRSLVVGTQKQRCTSSTATAIGLAR